MILLPSIIGWITTALYFVGIAIVLSVFVWSAWRTAKTGVHYLKRLHQVPCSRCAYFTGDYRLKCAVNPCIALTEQAIHCRDYEPATVPIKPAPGCKSACGCLSSYEDLSITSLSSTIQAAKSASALQRQS